MSGILIHAFRMVFGNLGAALRVSLGPTLIVTAWVFSLFYSAGVPLGATITSENIRDFPWGLFAVTFLVAIFCILWIATAWHRFILLEEQPGMLPNFNGGRMLAYLGQGILLTIFLIIVAMIVGFIVGLILFALMGGGAENAGGGGAQGLLFAVLVNIPLLFIYYRLCPVLPGAAIGEALSYGEAFSKTSPGSMTLLFMGLFWALALFFGGLLIQELTNIVPIIGVAANIAFSWVVAMVNLSIMTTIYGHYVEGRDLNV